MPLYARPVSEGGEAEGAVHAVREESFQLAAPEKRFLRWSRRRRAAAV